MSPRHRQLHATAPGAAALLCALLTMPTSAPAHTLAAGEGAEAGESSQAAIPSGGRAVRRRGARSRHCRPTAEVSAREVAAGETVTVSGALICGEPEEAPNQTITLLEHAPGPGHPGMEAVATTITAPNGSYQVTSPPVNESMIFVVRGPRGQGARVRVNVAAHVSLETGAVDTPSSPGCEQAPLAARSSVSFNGVVTPADAEMMALLQRELPSGSGNWRRIEQSPVALDGHYSMDHSFRRPGDANLRILVRRAGHFVGASAARCFLLIGRQNPKLTIEGPMAPVTYGSSIQIHGTAAGAPKARLQLLARTRGGPLAAIASAVTDGGGGYSFSQTPTSNTTYVVRNARTHSVAFPVQVRYALSVLEVPTGMSAGEAFTFSGTVAPAPAGTVVYLDRGNASGTEFHPIETASPADDGTFTLTHVFLGDASGTYRVRVAGTPALVAATGTPFAVLLNP